MQNKINTGKTLDWTNGTGADVVSGQVVGVGSIIGVAMGDIANGASGVLDVSGGTYELKKEAALAITQGDKVYWDTVAKEVDKTNTNLFIGYAAKSAVGGDATVLVLASQEGK